MIRTGPCARLRLWANAASRLGDGIGFDPFAVGDIGQFVRLVCGRLAWNFDSGGKFVSPWKWRRKPLASFVESMPTIKWMGLETRSSKIGERPRHDFSRRGIMPAIDPDLGALRRQIMEFSRRKPLQPSGPNRSRYALCNRLLGHMKAFQQSRRCDGGARIFELMPPEEAWQRQIEEAILVLENEPAMLLENVPVPATSKQGEESSSARASMTPSAASLCRETMAGLPRFRMPAFSPAIASIVSPRNEQ